jgi:hypothetical protein
MDINAIAVLELSPLNGPSAYEYSHMGGTGAETVDRSP